VPELSVSNWWKAFRSSLRATLSVYS
jgi:hypothetical protein